jgi:hypothetical protein
VMDVLAKPVIIRVGRSFAMGVHHAHTVSKRRHGISGYVWSVEMQASHAMAGWDFDPRGREPRLHIIQGRCEDCLCEKSGWTRVRDRPVDLKNRFTAKRQFMIKASEFQALPFIVRRVRGKSGQGLALTSLSA